MEMQQDNNQKIVIIATLSFIVGFALAWLILGNKAATVSQKTTKDTAEMTNEVGEIATTSPNFIVVHDQPAGAQVAVESARLEAVGWVVIHDEENGATGARILGAQLFTVGTSAGTVDLLRGTLSGHTYYAMLHVDNGDRSFDPKKDAPVISEDGKPVMTKFTAGPEGTGTEGDSTN